jgi:hypothetical protein
VRAVPNVRADCWGFRLCFCVNVIFIFEGIFHGKDRLRWIHTMFGVIVIFICESSVRSEDTFLGNYIIFVCDFDIYF